MRIGTNLSLFAVLVLSGGPCSDPKQFPVYYININHLAFAKLCPTAPDERDRWSFPRSSMAFRKTRILPRYIPLQFWTPKNFKNFLCFCVFLLHWVSGMMEVEELLRSSAPQLNDTGNIEERTRNNPSNNNSGFFWGKCAVYFHKEVIFTFRENSYLLLASSTTYCLTYIMKLINFGPISSTNLTFLQFFTRFYRKFSII